MNAVESNVEHVVEPEFFAKLQEQANMLVGQPYLFSRVTYGDELTIHFGTERAHTHSKLAAKVRGSHVLSLRGSAWMLRSGVNPVIIGCGITPSMSFNPKPFNVTALESGAHIRPGARVSKAIPIPVLPMKSVGLIVDLDDGSAFTILPTPASGNDEDGLEEPCDWELLAPHEWLRVGPGATMKTDPV